jgi:hypothetical protein
VSETTAALAVAPVRLSPVRRLEMAERLIDLAGAAILLGHPAAYQMVRLKAGVFYYPRTDAVLLRAIPRLESFINECAARGHTLPATHPLYVAPPPAPALQGAV